MPALTWIVRKEEIGSLFTISELKEFSKKHGAIVKVESTCVIENGEITKEF